jgi:hypothetical protein
MRWCGLLPCRVVGVEAPRRRGAPCGRAMTALDSLGVAALVADGPCTRFKRWISAPHRVRPKLQQTKLDKEFVL